jgi:hypothetical protein
MVKQIPNFALHIAIGWLFLYLFPIRRLVRLLCLTLMAAGQSVSTYVHDVVGESAFYHPHHEGARFVAKYFHDADC